MPGAFALPGELGLHAKAQVQAMTTDTTIHAEALPGSIEGSREVIDAIDDAIIELLGQRKAVSAHIQALRASAGEGRVAMSREYEVMARYRSALDRPGARVAVSVLELCRGAR